MIARNSDADVNVVALIGERGREVKEFVEDALGEEGMKKSVLVCSTGDQPPLIRQKCLLAATAVCEYFRDQGKKVNALFLFTKVHFIKLLCVIDSLREKVSLNLEN